MSERQTPIADDVFYTIAHPSQEPRFYLALVFSIILFPLIAIGLVVGTIVLVVPVIALLLWIGARVMFAGMVGNSILVSSVNYPRVNTLVEQLKAKIGYAKPVYIFVYEHGQFNAYMRHLFFRRAIFLNSELLESGVGDAEIGWIVARFIGYLRARREAGVLDGVVRAAQHLIVFNLFILPYERALVYTGDRIAVAAIDGDISSTISALQKLLVGRQLGYSVNPEGIIAQRRMLKGSVFAFLARIGSSFPPLVSRYVDLIVFAKQFFPVQYASFEAANSGLPEASEFHCGLSRFSPQWPAIAGGAGFPAPPSGPRRGVATIVAAVILGVGFVAWQAVRPRPDVEAQIAPEEPASFAAPAPAQTPPRHFHCDDASGEATSSRSRMPLGQRQSQRSPSFLRLSLFARRVAREPVEP